VSTADARRLVAKLWNYCDVLRDDGVSTIDYVEQLTYLLFLKMAHERANRPLNPETALAGVAEAWQRLVDSDGDKLENEYRHTLTDLGAAPGTLGVIFRKAQNKIQDPAKLKRLIVDLIDKEKWSSQGVDVKGDAYEELLAKSAEDIKSGAGQYFTPRALISTMVDCVLPGPDDTVCDPACGTGGFLLAAAEHIIEHHGSELNPDQRRQLVSGGIWGVELVDGTARLAAMNMLLHGIGRPNGPPLIEVRDSLAEPPSRYPSVVLANPPFGKKSSITVIGEGGRASREDIAYHRNDFWVTTTNKQLNFVQHIASMLGIPGRAAVVVPDNVCCSRVVRARRYGGGYCSSSTCIRCCGCRPGSSTPAESRPTCCSSTSCRPGRGQHGRRRCGCTTSAPASTSRSSRAGCSGSTWTTSSPATGPASRARPGRRPSGSVRSHWRNCSPGTR